MKKCLDLLDALAPHDADAVAGATSNADAERIVRQLIAEVGKQRQEMAASASPIVYSGRELGAFDPFANIDELEPDEIIVDSGLSKDEIAGLTEELAELQEPLTTQVYDPPSAESLSAVGIMAEAAYKPIGYAKTDRNEETAIVRFRGQPGSGERSFHIVAYADRPGAWLPKPAWANNLGTGAALGFPFAGGGTVEPGLTRGFAEAYNNRVLASIDLLRRGFDLAAAVPPSAKKRVVDTWARIAALPGAFEFKAAKIDRLAPTTQRLQQAADSMLAGSRYTATADVGSNTGWYELQITDHKTGDTATGEIEYVAGADRRMVAHNTGMDAGTGLGKPFYQVVFAFGHEIGVPTNADRHGLTGVNTYRRTEQMMSAAARAGAPGAVNPGVGQRIYGWKKDAKTKGERADNFARIALASARNAAELVPEVRDLAYDVATNAFSWRAGRREIDAEKFVSQALKGRDARAASISRSTLARAAITFSAIDGKLSLKDVSSVASPVLYSRRGGMFHEAEAESAAFSNPRLWTEEAFIGQAPERDDATVDRALYSWANDLWNGRRPKTEVAVLSAKVPHAALLMGKPAFGSTQPIVMPDHVVAHIKSRHAEDGIGPKDIARIPDGLARPRAVVFDADGSAMVVLPAAHASGSPLAMHITKDTLTSGRQELRVSRVNTLYSLDNSAHRIIEAMRDGKRVWMPADELARVRRIAEKKDLGMDFPISRFDRGTQDVLRGFQRRTVAASVLSDAALARYQSGDLMWANAAETIAVPTELRELRGIAFSQREGDQATVQSRRQQGRFTLSDFGWVDRRIEGIQDRYNRWKQAIDQVREQGGVVDEANDFYAAEERYWGRTGAAFEDFQREMEGFVEAVADDKLMLSDVALYAYAEHAKERNDYIASMRQSMPDGGSGMTEQEANDVLDQARLAGIEPQLKRHAQALRDIIQGTRDLLHTNGLLSDEEYRSWNTMFQKYVPLRGLEGVEETRGTGQGFNIRGKEGKHALGRKSQARQIIEQVAQDRQRAIVRIGKNEVARSFLKFVLDNPSPNLWEVNSIEYSASLTVDQFGNRIIEERPTLINDDRTISVKDGGRETYIAIFDEKLLEQMRNMHIENQNRLISAGLAVNRVLGRLYTSLNPVFTVLNFSRDLQAGTLGMIDEIGFVGAARLWASLPRAMADSFEAEEYALTGGKSGSYSQDYQLYRATGGKTGFFDFKTLDAQAAELQTMLDNAERVGVDPRVLGPKALALIEAMNGGLENATRLAAFKAARESGKTTAEAARISKNITVNFNRKGTLTPALSAMFLFFNPAVQGTTRMIQALGSPKVLGTLGLGMLGIFMLAMRNAAMGDDDDGVAWWDKIPDEVKERNLIIVLPPKSQSGVAIEGSTTKAGRYIKIPMPYGYNFFAVVANQVADVWRNMQDPKRGRDAARGTVKALNAFLGSWMPVQELGRSIPIDRSEESAGKSLVMAAVPDSLSPVAQILLNQSAFGRPLYPDDQRSRHMPDSTKFFPAQAGTLFQRAAEWMNAGSGGTPYTEGLFDFSPATLETLARGYGGGPVGFGIDVLNAIYLRHSIERADVRTEALPFAKQLYGVIDAETDRMLGYQRLEEAAKKVEPLKQAQRDGVGDPELAADPLSRLGVAVDVTRRALAEVRKKELSVVADQKMTDSERYVELLKSAERRRQALQNFNRAYDEAVVRAAAKRQSEN